MLLAVSSGCDSDASSCPDGSETCPCTEDYKCLNGLTCLSDRCVDVSWTPPANVPDSDGNPGGVDTSNGSFDNAAACEAWLDSLESLNCGFENIGAAIDCNAYANVSCDLDANGLFDCFTNNVSCEAGVPDLSGLASCTSQATCE